jgi:Na+/melibiose symporter-like transporter
VLLSVTLGPLLGAPISAIALRYIEKRTLSIIAFLAIALLQLWPPLLQLMGLLSLTSMVTAVILFINTIAGPLPAAFSAVAPLFLLGYHLNRRRHAQIIAVLEQRHVDRLGAAG